MTLKEEFEILRGEPIRYLEGDPMDIPCIETSDAEKLCRRPVVSVHMLAYNHEPYIKQAIEGVMMQKTDFEFELVIGEDASQDKTREICFEYQKKYPDKIRVLWWHENLRKVNHPAGGNYRRVMSHCRGEFVAFCEGDDYWINPLKLQMQANVMQKHPSVGYCFTGVQVKAEIPRDHPRLRPFLIKEWLPGNKFVFDHGAYRPGFVPQKVFWNNRHIYPRTCTVMIRRSYNELLGRNLDLLNWKLLIGDAVLWMAFPLVSDAFFLPDITSVYRLNAGGASLASSFIPILFHIDTTLVNLFCSIEKGESQTTIDKLVLKIVEARHSIARLKGENSKSLVELTALPLVRNAIKRGNPGWKACWILAMLGVPATPGDFRRRFRFLKRPANAMKKIFSRTVFLHPVAGSLYRRLTART